MSVMVGALGRGAVTWGKVIGASSSLSFFYFTLEM
jgi:hypothetical protein